MQIFRPIKKKKKKLICGQETVLSHFASALGQVRTKAKSYSNISI